jgi:hypothetical protein
MILAEGANASAGPLGFTIVIVMGVVTVLLIRNMNKRLRRLPPSFDPPPLADDGDGNEPDSLAG